MIKYTHRMKTSAETGEPHSTVEVFEMYRFTLAPARLQRVCCCTGEYRLRYWNRNIRPTSFSKRCCTGEYRLRYWNETSNTPPNRFFCCTGEYRLRYWNGLSPAAGTHGARLHRRIPLAVLKLNIFFEEFLFGLVAQANTACGIETHNRGRRNP